MSALYRTQPLRTSHYSPDGKGRDTYIQTNNGGVFKGGDRIRLYEPQRTVKREFSPTSPRLDAKPLKYNSDGSGRDTYIGVNHGGLFSSYDKHSFYNSLREYSPRSSLQGQYIFHKTQSSWARTKTSFASTQGEFCKRLSEPKHRDSLPRIAKENKKSTTIY